jgi:hypothetical protein
LQYLVGRLSSPTTAPADVVDVYDDGLSSVVDLPSACHDDALVPGGDDVQSDAVETGIVLSKENDHTGSTVSLNELLDSCMFDGENNAEAFADPEAASIDPSGWVAVGDILGKQWMDCVVKSPKSGMDLEGSDAKTSSSENSGGLSYNSASAVTDNLPDFLLSIRNCYKRTCAEFVEKHPSSSDVELDGKYVINDIGSKMMPQQGVTHSNASSPGTCSETARTHDDGYHSNATSATSPEVTACVIEDQFVTTR